MTLGYCGGLSECDEACPRTARGAGCHTLVRERAVWPCGVRRRVSAKLSTAWSDALFEARGSELEGASDSPREAFVAPVEMPGDQRLVEFVWKPKSPSPIQARAARTTCSSLGRALVPPRGVLASTSRRGALAPHLSALPLRAVSIGHGPRV